MTFGSRIKQISLSTIDALQEFKWISFLSKVNQILVIPINSYVCISSPCFLNLLSRKLIFGFELNFFLSFQESSPGPLDLYGGDMVHRKSVIFEKSPCKRHLVSSLNNCSTIVSQALVFILMNHIELRGQKLLSQFLSCAQMCVLIIERILLILLILTLISNLGLHLNSLLLEGMLIQSVLLLLHLIDLTQLLQLLLVLHLLGSASELHILNDQSSLLLKLLSLLLKPFLLEVRNEHASLFPFQI